jgi:hypothetical protein
MVHVPTTTVLAIMNTELLLADNQLTETRGVSDFPREDIDPKLVAQFLARKVISQNPEGFTFDPINWTLRSFRPHVYTVSLFGYGRAFRDLPNEVDLLEWVYSNLEALSRYGNFVGGYQCRESSKYFMDLSIAVIGLKRATELARKNRQDSIYHSATGDVIPV